MRTRIVRAGAGIATIALAATLVGLGATSASAAVGDPLLETTFDDTTGWTAENVNVAGMADGYQGWSFHTLSDVVAKWGSTSSKHGEFALADGIVAVVQSDANKPASGTFSSTLWSPEVELQDGTGAVEIAFESHYRQGQNPAANLVISVDGGEPTVVEEFSANRYNEQVDVTASVPTDAESVKVGWQYLESSNNWYWMIDGVTVSETEPAAAAPTLLNEQKPVGHAGDEVAIEIGGLRAGQIAQVSFAGTTSSAPAADASGETTATVTIPADARPGTQSVTVSGDGIAETDWSVTVVASASSDYATTEDVVWFDGFEQSGEGWGGVGGSGWKTAVLTDLYDSSAPDRRHAFTRATGQVAAVDASSAAVDAELVSPAIAVEGGDALELRVDSHYRDRGEQSGSIVAEFDTGETTTLKELSSGDEESIQLRLPIDVPEGATTLTLRFAFIGAVGSGSWYLDSAQVVHPLSTLADDATPTAVLDVFSDVQGSTGNTNLTNNVLPGLRSLTPQADTVVSLGDLVSQGSAANYAAYDAAFAAGGGDEYDQAISIMGNHEFYGSDGSDTYRQRFLDYTGMADVGGEGGFWGETVIDDELPVLWIASEFYDYGQKNGASPFVELSDEQFTWLQGRLDYWASQDKPVLLLSHHVLPQTVTATYARFYQQDFDDDAERFEELLAAYPNVVMLDGHTHWAVDSNDWSVQKRFDGSALYGSTIVNTGAVTTQYGPNGDWEEKALGSDTPTGLRVALYEDRLRVTVYEFASGGAATEMQHIDVALPTTVSTEPTETPTPAETPEATETPDATSTPEPTAMPEPSATPSATATSEPSEPSETPQATEPVDTAEPEATASPDSTPTSVPTAEPVPTDSVTVEPTVEPVPSVTTGPEQTASSEPTPSVDPTSNPEPGETVEPSSPEPTETALPPSSDPNAGPTASTDPSDSPQTPDTGDGDPVEPTLQVGAATVTAGGSVTITGSGFTGPAEAPIELHSTPVRIGTASISAAGTVNETVTIPAGTEPGAHRIVIVLDDGTEVSVAIEVAAASALTPTGGAVVGVVLAIALGLAVGGVATAFRRSRAA